MLVWLGFGAIVVGLCAFGWMAIKHDFGRWDMTDEEIIFLATI